MTRQIMLACLLLATGLAATRAAHAAESYDNCTGFIASIPATISNQGTWCLNKDLASSISSGSAITVATNNVTIDCNDFKIGGLAAGAGTSTHGVYALDHFNVTVRHCNIRGFYQGILLAASNASSSGGHLVEDNRFDGNTYESIDVAGDGSTVRGNRVFDTGGSSLIGDAHGIATTYNVDVLGNTVTDVLASSGSAGSGTGIATVNSINNSVSGNRVHGVLSDGVGTSSYGIRIFTSARTALRDNDLLGSAASGSIGISCADGNASARDNEFNGFATAISTCTDSGGNTVH